MITPQNVHEHVRHGFVDSGGVRIHYAETGEGPLVVLIHGFPDFWHTWRHQLPVLAPHFRCVAVDLRGYNLSDRPEGNHHYAMKHLVQDIRNVVNHFGGPAVIVGHDWGGSVAWHFAMRHPELTSRLAVVNLPHPWALARELASNEQQRASSQYTRDFQKPGAEDELTPEGLAEWLPPDEHARSLLLEALSRSDFTAMLAYYRMNYPREPYEMPQGPPPSVDVPVLLVHGLRDWALLPGALNGTWDLVKEDLTLVTVPRAGHWVHHQRPDVVNRALLGWLLPVPGGT